MGLQDPAETNELHTENGVLIVCKKPDQDGKIMILRKKESSNG